MVLEVEPAEAVELAPLWLLSADEPDWGLLPEQASAIIDGGGDGRLFDAPAPALPGSLRGGPSRISPRELFDALRDLFSRAPTGKVVAARHRAVESVPVLWVASPAVNGSVVTASWSVTSGRSGKLSIELGPMSGGAGVSCKISSTDQLEVAAGGAEIGWLELPVWKETRMVVPPGGYEEFPVNYYWPDDERPAGFRGEALRQEDIPSDYPDLHPAPLTSPDTLKGSMTETISVETKLSVGLTSGTDPSLGATASLSGEIDVTASWELPEGSYRRYWLSDPPGCAIL